MLNSPLLWLALSVFLYQIGVSIHQKLKTPLANPLLLSTILLCGILMITKTPTTTYQVGGAFLTLFLTPATVALAVPIYRQLETLKKHYLPILSGALVGSIVSMGSVYFLCRLFGLKTDMIASLLPKSVTTPIGMEIASSLGGIPAITAIAIIITGLFGAVILPSFLSLIGIKHPVAIGVAIGTSSHAVGTSRAVQLGDTEGAMSGLAIGIAGLITAVLASLFLSF